MVKRSAGRPVPIVTRRPQRMMIGGDFGEGLMATNSKIRVGIVGANPPRGFASIAHIPALQVLPEFAISAVCTTRQDSADAAARHHNIPTST
jgi:hypothetical protein